MAEIIWDDEAPTTPTGAQTSVASIQWDSPETPEESSWLGSVAKAGKEWIVDPITTRFQESGKAMADALLPPDGRAPGGWRDALKFAGGAAGATVGLATAPISKAMGAAEAWKEQNTIEGEKIRGEVPGGINVPGGTSLSNDESLAFGDNTTRVDDARWRGEVIGDMAPIPMVPGLGPVQRLLQARKAMPVAAGAAKAANAIPPVTTYGQREMFELGDTAQYSPRIEAELAGTPRPAMPPRQMDLPLEYQNELPFPQSRPKPEQLELGKTYPDLRTPADLTAEAAERRLAARAPYEVADDAVLPQPVPRVVPETNAPLRTAAEVAATRDTAPVLGEGAQQVPSRFDPQPAPTILDEFGNPIPKAPEPVPAARQGIDENPFTSQSGALDLEAVGKAMITPTARTVGGAAVGASQGETTEERIRNAIIGALAGRLAPKLSGTVRNLDAAATAANKSFRLPNYTSGWMQRNLEMPEHVASTAKTPEARAAGADVIRSGKRAIDTEERLDNYFQQKLAEAYEPIHRSKGAVEAVGRLLDTENGAALAQTQLRGSSLDAYTKARAALNEVADSLGMPKDQRVSDYFPRLREEAVVSKTVKLGPSQFTRQSLDSLRNHERNAWFLQARTSKAQADDYSLEALKKYVRGASSKIAIDGGIDPATKQAISGFLKEVEDVLPHIPTELAGYFGRYINDVIGVGGTALKDTNRFVRAVKSYEFSRTIGFNPLSAMVNSTQQLLTVAHVSPQGMTAGYKEAFKALVKKDKKLLAELKANGIQGSLSKGDIAALEKLGENWADKAVDWSGTMFRKVESLNRAQAYFAGKYDALNGLGGTKGVARKGKDAVEYARDIVDQTQFRLDRASLPENWRKPGPRQLALQFKGFQAKYTQRLKDMAKQDIEDFVRAENPIEAAKVAVTSKSAKFWVTGSLLFGTDVMTLGWDKTMGLRRNRTEARPDGEALFTGAFPLLAGVYLGHQVGLGSLPLEDAKSVMFSVVGPTASSILDGLSLGVSLATGKEYDYSTRNWFSGRENGIDPMDPESNMSRVIRALPGGVQVDRIRKGVNIMRQEPDDSIRRPLTGEQAFFGAERIPEETPQGREMRPWGLLPPRVAEATRTITGLPSRESSLERDDKQEARTLDKQGDAMLSRAHTLFVAGKEDEAQDMIDAFNDKHGTNYRLTAQGRKNARQKTYQDPKDRQIRQMPKAARSRGREILEQNEPEDEE